jgi:hypothetical protein
LPVAMAQIPNRQFMPIELAQIGFFIVFCNFFTKNAIIFVVIPNFISTFVTK